MISYTNQIKTDLRLFLAVVAGLLAIGFLFIYSASSVYALETYGSSLYFVKKHLIGFGVGIIALIIARITPLSLIQKYSPLLFLGSLGLTALTLFPYISHRIHGSSRWLSIAGFGFQPSELLKISLILYVAYLLAKKNHHHAYFKKIYLPIAIILIITSSILLKQPDFGLTVTLVTTVCMMLFIAQLPIKYIIGTICTLVPAGIFLIIMRPYRVKRVLTFLNPWSDPQGAGFQIIQSLIAIGSGSFWGVGISQSKQKFFYLPMQHTDFIFSIIAEETGFIGSLFLIVLFISFLYLGIRLAWKMSTQFSQFATLGLVTLTSLQALINLAVATGLAPTKGIGLPFVSYGNTALVCNLAMIGLIINMAHEK